MTHLSTSLGSYQATVDQALETLATNNIVERIWAHDHTVWRDDPTEISNRLDWLSIADEMQSRLWIIKALAGSLNASRYTDVVVLGMGGSSLAPDMFGKMFASDDPRALRVSILDSTDAGAVRAVTERLHPEDVCFIVSTKSGGTVETLSFFKYFYNWTLAEVGAERVGEHFVAITDPGSKLETLARDHDFRHIYLNNPNIGGRYAALSFFGLVPAACAGVDIEEVLKRAQAIAKTDMATQLGAILGMLAQAGRDKLTLVGSAELAPFGDWVEQLIAESTGKEGKGILPIVGEPLNSPTAYGDDRVFVSLELSDFDPSPLDALAEADHPVLRFTLQDKLDIGAHFWLWEMATAIAGHILDIQPFDQPNVEAAKVSAREAIAAYEETGELPEGEESVVSDFDGLSRAAATINTFLRQANRSDYIAIHAYVQPTDATNEALQTFRNKLGQQTKLATTVGYGPRFLHSTGQLHKGDDGNGLFIQLIATGADDLPIPDQAGAQNSSISFDTLKQAQALGDAGALRGAQRRLLTLKLSNNDLAGQIRALAERL